MKKVLAIIGSQRRKNTLEAVREFERNLKQLGDVEFEYVFLSDCRLEFCQGCKLCFDKGEVLCPLKDDRDGLLEKLERSDGIIFATPSYAFQVSARMKNLIDRIAFLFHRPRFFGKTCTALVTQGFFGGDKIRRYLESTGFHMGYDKVRGCCVSTLEPMSESRQKKLRQKVRKASGRFYKSLTRKKPAVPSLFRLMAFRMMRSGLQAYESRYYDYYYYEEKGWFASEYYHETHLGPIKKLAGRFFDFLGKRMFQNS
jgi:hypothetical protein